MRNETVGEVGGRRLVLMDSISLIGPGDAGAVIVSGSHGGAISAAFASLHPPHLVVFNDAGGGKADAGFAALDLLDRDGIACLTVDHASARIGDALDTWQSGVVSGVGRRVAAKGVGRGQTVATAVEAFVRDHV